jgi:hypothetical protein
MENNQNNSSIPESKHLKEVVIDSHTACCRPRNKQTPKSPDENKHISPEQPEASSTHSESKR